MSARSFVFNLLKIVLTAIVVYFVGRQVVRHWAEVQAFDWQLHVGYLAASLACGLIALFIQSSCWRLIIHGFGHEIGALMAFRIAYLSNLGRYIPGKIWQVFGILYLARREGVTVEAAGASFLIIQMFAIPASFLVYIIAAQFEPALLAGRIGLLGTGATWILLGALVALCVWIVVYPQPFIRLGNALLVRLGRPTTSFRLDKSVALQLFGGYFAAWAVYGVAFWLFIRAVAPESNVSAVAGAGVFNAAYQIGYLALFAPGGFGPREWVMGELLAPLVGPVAHALAVAARLWAIALEAIAALAALTIRK